VKGRPPMMAVPGPLHLQRVSLRVAGITVLISCVLTLWTAARGQPLWVMGAMALLPWLPVFLVEYIWKYEHYGAYAVFMAITLLQVGHFAEHSVQLLQLFLTHDINQSHGVFGPFDQEIMHLFMDSSIWVALCWLVYKFGSHNKWLWIAWLASSLHETEHLFLGWVYLLDNSFYRQGGSNGILALGGMIGGPLARPYLHWLYNFAVVVPILIAFWDQTQHAYDHFLARVLPDVGEKEMLRASAALHRLIVPAGTIVLQEGEVAARLYLVTEGEVEVIDSGGDIVQHLGPGQSFGELGLLANQPYPASVRTTRRTELMELDRPALLQLFKRSPAALSDFQAALDVEESNLRLIR
jgi:hypothetical protein